MSLLPASALTSVASGYAAAPPPLTAAPAVLGVPSRDDAIADFGSTAGSLNLLAQAASALGVSSASGVPGAGDQSQLTLPPLPQMPPPPPDPTAPTTDNGKSNVVFSDPDSDGDFIH